MRCLNMKIRYILYFIVNFIAIYSMKSPQDKISQTTTLANEEILSKNFDKGCPHLSKIIRENNFTDYSINCKPLNTENLTLNEENVLGYACLIVKNILSYLCVNKLTYINVPSISQFRQNYSSICPFNFSYLEELDFTFSKNKFINELKKTDHCLQVCKDLYSIKTQCIVLSFFNNYLKHVNLTPVQEDSSTMGVGEPSVKAAYPELNKQKNKSGAISTVQNKTQYSQETDIKEVTKEGKIETKTKTQNKVQYSQKNDNKEVTKEGKIETKVETPEVKLGVIKSNSNEPINEEKKTEKTMISTPKQKLDKKVEIPESERKFSEDENFILDNNESKPKNDEFNEDDSSLSSIGGEPVPVKTYFSQVPKSSKAEIPEVGMDSLIKGKDVYSGEGFFQAEDSHFFFYFIMVSSIIIVGYLAFQYKNKILAYALEGTNGRRNRRRPNPARYRKLETNLEEVISSNTTSAASSSVVY